MPLACKIWTLRFQRSYPALGLTLALAAYVGSRWFFERAGIVFDASPLDRFWQYLDPELLRHDLLHSLWLSHAQPPGFNAFLGTVVKICAEPTGCFLWAYRCMGLVLQIALYGLVLRMGVPPLGAALTAALFAFTPGSILYENWLFYTYPVATLLALATLCAAWSADRPTVGRVGLFFLIASLAALTRSVLHLAWLLGCLGILLALLPDARRRILAGALPLLLVLGWYAKNQVLFGNFGPSSWLGLSVAKLAIVPGTREQKRAWRAAGASSLVNLLPYGTPLANFPAEYRNDERGPATIHQALDAERKSTGAPNLNHRTYLELSDQYFEDSIVALRHNPEIYLQSAGRGLLTFLLPPSHVPFLAHNRRRIAQFDKWANLLAYAVPGDLAESGRAPPTFDSTADLMKNTSWLWALVLLGGTSHAILTLRKDRRKECRARAVAHALAAFTVLFLTFSCNLLEVTENNRMRMMIEPLILALIASAVTTAGRRVRSALDAQRYRV